MEIARLSVFTQSTKALSTVSNVGSHAAVTVIVQKNPAKYRVST
jgi:hypothetical protein